MKYIAILFLLVFSSFSFAQKEVVDFSNFFKGNKGAMVIYNKNTQKYIYYNSQRCKERFCPASTFKIPNSLIGLETGIIPDENFIIKWDGIKRGVEEWNRDHSLATAIKYSVVPYYQELARRVGKAKLTEYLTKIGYGNNTIGERADNFWLDNSLKISAEEQVEFLVKFYDCRLPFTKRSVDIVKKILPEEIYPKAKMKFKNGTIADKNSLALGWLVGYVEKEKETFFFAFNVEAKSYEEVRKIRDEIPRNILKYLKIIE